MAATPTNKSPLWKELIEEERRYREKLVQVRAKKRRMPTHAECSEAMKEVLAEKRFAKYKAELTRGGGLVSSRFEWCKTWRDIVEEWDDIMWILPPEERHDRRGPRLVIDSTTIEPQQA